MSNKRIETKSSRTAAYTCFARGCATRDKDPRFRGPDTMAEVMFPPLARLSLNFSPLRKFLMRQMFPPGIYEYVLARTKVMDAVFVDALQARFAQIVLLGAGFDTRALRFADRNYGTKVIELDVATTQQPKIEILRRKKIAPLPAAAWPLITFTRGSLHPARVGKAVPDGARRDAARACQWNSLYCRRLGEKLKLAPGGQR